MKKSTKKIITSLAILTLVGCGHEKNEEQPIEITYSDEPVVEEQIQPEQEEVETEEPSVEENETNQNESTENDAFVDTTIEVIDKMKPIAKEAKGTLVPIAKQAGKDVKKIYNHYKNENEHQSTKELKEQGELFSQDELQKTPYESYGELDYLGRTTEANAILHQSLMPTEKRQSISSVKPSGWNNKKYDIVDGGWLYNRSHLIGFQLAGENANEKNLITGTRQLNMAMLDYENEIAEFLKQSENNYVRYRVTPIYTGDNLVADGVQIDAVGYGDDALDFSVYIPNEQEGIEINYANGESRLK